MSMFDDYDEEKEHSRPENGTRRSDVASTGDDGSDFDGSSASASGGSGSGV